MLGMAYDEGYKTGFKIGRYICESEGSGTVPEGTHISPLSDSGGTVYMKPPWMLTAVYARAERGVAGERFQGWSLVEVDSSRVTEKRFESDSRLADIWEESAPGETDRIRVQIEGAPAEILAAMEGVLDGVEGCTVNITPVYSVLEERSGARPRGEVQGAAKIPKGKAGLHEIERPVVPNR